MCPLNWGKFKYNDVHAIIGDGSFVAIKGNPNNCILKVHVPVDISGVKADIGGAVSSAIGGMIRSKFLTGGSFGKIHTTHALENALADKENEKAAMIQQGRKLEEQTASYIDECIKSRATVQTSSDDVATQLRKLSDLKDSGILSSEEFELKKKELLSRI